MFVDWRIQCCYNVHSSQVDLEIQHNPNQNSVNYLVNIEKLISKYIWEGERSKIANIMLKKNNKVERLTLFNFKTYYKATVIRTA